jgi:hypothetical protein
MPRAGLNTSEVVASAAELADKPTYECAKLFCVSLIWCAHIGFDRAIGYGLKYSHGFSFTHLGRIGRIPVVTPPTS